MPLTDYRQPTPPRVHEIRLNVKEGQVARVMLPDASIVLVEPTGEHAYIMPKGSRVLDISPIPPPDGLS